VRKTRITLAVLALSCAAGAAWWFTPPHPPSASVTLGPAPTLSVIQAGDERAAKPAPSPVAAAPQPAPRPELHPLSGEFKRLTAPGATPAMLSRAFDLVRDCRIQDRNLAAGVQPPPMQAKQYCKLAPGQYEDDALTRRMIEARIQRADFGAVNDLQSEYFGAYRNDRATYRQLQKEAVRIGLERGEPVVLSGEYAVESARAEALRESGDLAGAAAAYRQAAVYAVASAIGQEKENGRPSPNAQKSVELAMGKVPVDQQAAVINEGRELAAKWRKT
jgi:hypothetical protein